MIGITSRIMNVDNKRIEFVNQAYLKIFQSLNLNSVLITTNNPNLPEILSLCTGFLITGGDDLDPKNYQEENDGQSKNVEPLVDELDKQIIAYAINSKKPLLGICRGLQSINVFSGGSLFQDISSSHQGSFHKVQTFPNRLLSFPKIIEVNSYHHQAIKRIAADYQIIAQHQDGTIEAIIHKNLPILAVQWHPELHPDSESSQILFSVFKEMIKAVK